MFANRTEPVDFCAQLRDDIFTFKISSIRLIIATKNTWQCSFFDSVAFKDAVEIAEL